MLGERPKVYSTDVVATAQSGKPDIFAETAENGFAWNIVRTFAKTATEIIVKHNLKKKFLLMSNLLCFVRT